ncbi:MAG TPA: SprT family zinc-dependent metalloprotease [Bacteroidales bacterium]|nr:SprT family zinc-dependent metalloprotease [Bacteroidales bacterium]
MNSFSYKTIFTKRKTISIILSPTGKITIRAPYGTPKKTIEDLLNKKADWIQKHLTKYTDYHRLTPDRAYRNGDPVLFLGREYPLKLSESGSNYIQLSDTNIEAFIKAPIEDNKVRMILEKWYLFQAGKVIRCKVQDIITLHSRYGFSPSEIVTKRLKSRWGSCSTRGRITINSELIKLEMRFLEYVIIHELCHLKYHNHGKDFYRLLEQIVPDYKIVRQELRKYIIE